MSTHTLVDHSFTSVRARLGGIYREFSVALHVCVILYTYFFKFHT